MGNRSLTWLAALVLAALPVAAARAQEPGTGFEAGLRAGYMLPLGEVQGNGSNNDLDDGISGAVPLWLDVGYRALPELFVGLYGQYAFAFMSGDIEELCDSSETADCSASDIRLGLQVHYHPVPQSVANPWVGLGFGYEWLGISIEGPGGEVSITPHGFEFANLQAGLDFKVTDHFYLGPVLSFSLGQYGDVSVDCSVTSTSNACESFDSQGEIEDKALHEWLMFAVRGAYAP